MKFIYCTLIVFVTTIVSAQNVNQFDANGKRHGVWKKYFDDTTVYTLGIGRKFSDSFSASLSYKYEPSNGKPSSPFSPQDGERAINLGGKFTAKSGLMTSVGIQYRELGDTVTTASSGSLPFKDNKVVTVGLKFAKSF